jgi:hypothetical protein
MTPSYASALGASGDRPAALAELMGIIVNGGLRRPLTRVSTLQFATGTPYETHLTARPMPGERVLQPEVADVVRRALIGVVEQGTARRLEGMLRRHDGSSIEIGGKTGTGDHRYDTHGRDGQVLSSRVVNRSATLVFFICSRWSMALAATPRTAAPADEVPDARWCDPPPQRPAVSSSRLRRARVAPSGWPDVARP